MASISLFTAWIEPLITKRPFRREELWLSFLILVGLAWVLGFAFDHWLGLTLAILAALLAAIFPSCNRVFVQRGHSAISITAYEMLGAFTVCFVAALWQNEPMIPQGFDYLWIMILALICTVFAFALSVHLLKRLTAYTTALALNFEPVYGILLAAWIFQEHRDMGLQFYLGTLVLISANLIHVQLTRYQSRQHKRAASCSD